MKIELGSMSQITLMLLTITSLILRPMPAVGEEGSVSIDRWADTLMVSHCMLKLIYDRPQEYQEEQYKIAEGLDILEGDFGEILDAIAKKGYQKPTRIIDAANVVAPSVLTSKAVLAAMEGDDLKGAAKICATAISANPEFRKTVSTLQADNDAQKKEKYVFGVNLASTYERTCILAGSIFDKEPMLLHFLKEADSTVRSSTSSSTWKAPSAVAMAFALKRTRSGRADRSCKFFIATQDDVEQMSPVVRIKAGRNIQIAYIDEQVLAKAISATKAYKDNEKAESRAADERYREQTRKMIEQRTSGERNVPLR
ncbi:MAG: hypothetical protein Q7R40_02925 [Phaeospirillum sp.]|nr:hypothetical protein [Phaeospirillum sp.]